MRAVKYLGVTLWLTLSGGTEVLAQGDQVGSQVPRVVDVQQLLTPVRVEWRPAAAEMSPDSRVAPRIDLLPQRAESRDGLHPVLRGAIIGGVIGGTALVLFQRLYYGPCDNGDTIMPCEVTYVMLFGYGAVPGALLGGLTGHGRSKELKT